MLRFLELSNHTLFFYYVISNGIYLLLLLIAIHKNIAHRHRLGSIRLEHYRESPFTPPISLLVPAHYEESFIVSSVRSLLGLNYPNLEVIVANDGSSDGTLHALSEAFGLRLSRVLYVPEIETAAVRGVYRSTLEPRLLVVDKESAGSKADAVNAALNMATSPYICIVDADSILETNSSLAIMAGVFSDPDRVVAIGGIVRVLNGSQISEAKLKHVALPKKPIEILQVIEYFRAFLIGREAWAGFNMLPIISGAFGIFRRDLVLKINGFRAHAIGEDFDLVVRMHRYLQEQKMDYHINFIPDPTCWTEVPADLRSLARQRARWHKGLFDTLWPNRDMLFNPRYGRVGCVILPYMWVFEFLAPIIECLGYFTIAAAAMLGALSTNFFLEFLLFGYAFATLISIGSVLLEEMTYRRYGDWKEVAKLLLYCLVEHFPYRQMTMIWRLQGIWQYIRGDLVWRTMKRVGTEASPALEE
ncbi:MAG: glycosyltransferase family 2 protein [Acidobacteriota bacterium]|nr:glycosyltransferase family 2 protein [Acidobacteriota bacterium]